MQYCIYIVLALLVFASTTRAVPFAREDSPEDDSFEDPNSNEASPEDSGSFEDLRNFVPELHIYLVGDVPKLQIRREKRHASSEENGFQVASGNGIKGTNFGFFGSFNYRLNSDGSIDGGNSGESHEGPHSGESHEGPHSGESHEGPHPGGSHEGPHSGESPGGHHPGGSYETTGYPGPFQIR